MTTSKSPFSLFDGIVDKLGSVQPPRWVQDEVQNRLVLLLNHVLQQEPEAMARLARQKSRIALMQWRRFSLRLQATPAGLLEIAPDGQVPDLTLTITDESPMSLAQAALRGDKPAVRIEGDVQFAAEINWLVEHVRWDLEEDLSRVIGDTPAHYVATVARRVAESLRGFVARKTATPAADTSGPSPDRTL
jgi:ubiquinone biosynthesis protein UbiJ